jgi:hypothetical protein
MGRTPRSFNRVPGKYDWVGAVNDTVTLLDDMIKRHLHSIPAEVREELVCIRAPLFELLVRANIRGRARS